MTDPIPLSNGEWGRADHRPSNPKQSGNMSNTTTKTPSTAAAAATSTTLPAMDEKLLSLAKEAVKTGGVISMAEAQKLLSAVKDGGKYTDTEKTTMAHVREHFKWTPEADEWFRAEVRKWAASVGN